MSFAPARPGLITRVEKSDTFTDLLGHPNERHFERVQKMTDYQLPMYERLEPRTPFKGGRITDTDVLTLSEAARFASVHAGAEIAPSDFLRAAGRGEITLRAIVHQTAKLQRIGGGVYCNAGQPNENTAPSGSILNLPLSACNQLAAAGRASWREFESFESIDGILKRYVVAELIPGEPDFETTTDDCRVTGNAVNALADAYIDEPAPVAGGKKWTPEKLAELNAYREAHTMPETADKFDISEQRIRELLPSKKPKAKPFAGLIHRI